MKKSNFNDNYFFIEALNSLVKGDEADFEKALEKFTDINLKDKDGRTLLIHAILKDNLNAVKKLIKNGSDVNIQDKNGWSPLHHSVNQNSVPITEILINEGANVNSVDNYGNTVIWRAVFSSKGYGDVIKILLANKADPSIKNSSGVSALDLAETIANYNILSFFSKD